MKKIEDFRDNGGEQKIGNIESIAQTYSEHVSNYLIGFTMDLLTNASNFIESGWLVNKFPDELNRMADAMNYVKSAEINANKTALTLSDLLDRINYRIQRTH